MNKFKAIQISLKKRLIKVKNNLKEGFLKLKLELKDFKMLSVKVKEKILMIHKN